MKLQKNTLLSMQMKLSPEDFEPATKQEQEELNKLTANTSYWKDAWRRLKQNKIAMISLVVIILFIIFAFVGPALSPYTYDQQVRGDENMAPNLKHLFGTDQLGRDLLTRVMVGSRISIIIGVGSALIVLVIGSLYGSIAGLLGGITDNIMMRIVEIIYSVPDILIIILLQIVIKEPLQKAFDSGSALGWLQKLGPGIVAIFIVYGLLYWVGMARIVRGQVLQLKQMEYINAASALGANNKRLILKHLLPNCIGTLIITTMLQIPSAIFTESFLSFLGLGVSVPMASLGSLASEA
jgi:oligopeptide transport system permease protein